MEFGILGPLEVRINGKPVPLGGAKQRTLLAALLLEPNRVVAAERLVELLWSGEPPETAANNLQVYISQLRRTLEPERAPGAPSKLLLSQSSGYLLVVGPDQLDLHRFERLAEGGRKALAAGDAELSASTLGAALALWRGPALADCGNEAFAIGERVRLEQMRLRALEDRVQAQLDMCMHADVVGELEALVAEHPSRERLCGQLMLALYRSARQADATEVFQRTRQRLVDELGLEPGPDLQRLLTQILNQDPSLDLAPRSAPHAQSRTHNLPLQVTSFVGRQQDVIDIVRRLGQARLVTLVGPPGVGKTRLALQVATKQVGKPRDGVWLVELAPLADPELVPQAVASAITERQQPGRLLAESLVGELQGRDVLLVVDNCEHLLEGVAGLVGVILAHCPEVRMLLTSRERLGLAGEVVMQVAPLRMPHIAATLPLETLRQFDAVHLFADRATLVLPHFTVSPGNAETVVQICRRLEGMPLALELAAAHMNAISPEGMLARLDDRFRLLGRSRGSTGHHRTLRAALDWSHELLAEEEKILFRRLSVFIGDWRLESAERVCASEPLAVEDVVVLLSRLVDKSLVMADPTLAGGRYRFLETVREYARHRLADSGELDRTRERHARHFLAMAETDRPLLRSLERAGWLTRLVEEEGNLRAGLEWSAAADSTEAAEAGLRLAIALGPFWESRGLYGEGRYWLDAFLARSPGRTATQGQALYWSGWLAYRASEFDAARARGEDGRSVAEELGDWLLLAMTLHLLGSIEGLMEQRSIGQAYLERSEQLYASLGDPRGLIVVIGQQALTPWVLGELATANALADRGLALAREAHLEVGATVDLVKSFVHLEQGELDEARTRLQEGLRRPHQEAMYVCVALEGLAGVAAAEGRSRRALCLASAAMTLVKKWSLHTGPGSSPLYKVFERVLRPAKEGLDTAASAAAAAEGSSMSEDEALEFALSDRDEKRP